MTGAERKRRWRRDKANREAEMLAHRTRRNVPGARLAECMRDTLRYSDNKVKELT